MDSGDALSVPRALLDLVPPPPAGALGHPVGAFANAAWWRSLTFAERGQVLRTHPEWVGPRDGIPARDRHSANLVLLARARVAATEALRRAGPLARKLDVVAKERVESIAAIDAVLAKRDGITRHLLLVEITTTVVRAITTVGDVDRAGHVATFVGGLSTSPHVDLRRNNTFLGVDFYLVQWLEKQGYDVSYTDDVSISQNPSQLLGHQADVVSGHSEYRSLAQYNGYLAARTAGVNLAAFSSNTTFWQVRYEDGGRTLVCYKTVQGSGTDGDGDVGANDWGPDGLQGTNDDALGHDGIAGTADDHPENATTTWRDNGAPNGDPNAPPGGRVGPNKPENSLWGVMYFGDNAGQSYPLSIPAGDANDLLLVLLRRAKTVDGRHGSDYQNVVTHRQS